VRARQRPKSVVCEATITRADGTVVPQGVVAYYHRNPLKRLAAKLRHPRLRGGYGKVKTCA